MGTILVIFVALVVCVAVVRCAVAVGTGLAKFFWRWSIPLVLIGFGLAVLLAENETTERYQVETQINYTPTPSKKISEREMVRRLKAQPETLEQMLARLERSNKR